MNMSFPESELRPATPSWIPGEITGFAPGTRIMTLEGAMPVETLRPGIRVITRSGALPLREIAAGATVYHMAFDRPEVVLTETGQVPTAPALAA